MDFPPKTCDPQWGSMLAIRAALEADGCYAVDLDVKDAQARVDLHWAARQAGRLLGVKVEINTSAAPGRRDSMVRATVRCVAGDGGERALIEAGLERLLQAVQATQTRKASSTVRPLRPRVSGEI